MTNISINIVGLGTETYPSGTTPLQILSSAKGVSKETIICKVDKVLTDLSVQLNSDCTVQFLDGKSKDGHNVLLHSTAHLMAQAVKRLYPKTKVTIGPFLENRFYYDFDVETPFTEEDLLKIEEEMLKISNENIDIIHEEKTREEALSFFKNIGEHYKIEIINDLDDSEILKVYSQGDFTDLCRGPHVQSTGMMQHFKLLSSSAAYWRGDENNQTLQRVYGTSFTSAKDLKKYLLMLEEQKKRDHRKIGKELDLYFHDEEVGPGLPLWTPNGAVIIDQLEALAKEKEDLGGYKRVRTPHLTKGTLYEKSGHLDHYMSSMYPAMDVDGTDYYMKPMNCPHHHKIYANSPKSYRDLPYRLSEYGTCYRYEKSGELFGLMRVRSMQMNDAHIYCTEDQFKEEFIAVCNLYMEYFKIFGIEKYEMRLSLHDPKDLGKKYINNPKLWKKTEDDVRDALKDAGLKFTESVGDAAFYGPKIDVQVWSAIGKEFSLATNQVDFAVPERFKLTYKDLDGKSKTPLCIHRAPLGTHERFIGFLIEHFGGNFPLWIAPRQVTILPVSDKYNDYAHTVCESLKTSGVRADVDSRSEKIGSKIRDAEMQKVNIMVIVGEKEVENSTLTIRRRFIKQQQTISLKDFSAEILDEINDRRVPN
ncbi:threonine--tRNA ligase [Candidatus Marinimicrobia bacterium]|nr:threonine--tRNA ligase [Candidatus Neomarinimicrobiota bacterium]MDC0521448.1 threonine--tRNA ligase [Candidatus Neomarinimicrobiota bacterium]